MSTRKVIPFVCISVCLCALLLAPLVEAQPSVNDDPGRYSAPSVTDAIQPSVEPDSDKASNCGSEMGPDGPLAAGESSIIATNISEQYPGDFAYARAEPSISRVR